MKTKQNRVPVSRRAVVQRVNRVLVRQGKQLRASRGWYQVMRLGEYWVLDLETKLVIERKVQLEPHARRLGVLRSYERLEG